ncbi:hypothetical protein JCM4814A_00880 [Streptomyces phaeofaciens JCM 4814]|uniref:Winged helix-turn helix domain-containing protein n=1 Tax=Streptomyces phaeofaciens TaxID=68254 RepID=A0A918HPT3_9ACTN|nr:hypothetical protein GCM10010226_82700 [Streptomyces phaeofaciens]
MLEQELATGPVALGWTDQTWTLARIKTLIGGRFHKTTTLSAIAQMLHRHGFPPAARPSATRKPSPAGLRRPQLLAGLPRSLVTRARSAVTSPALQQKTAANV